MAKKSKSGKKTKSTGGKAVVQKATSNEVRVKAVISLPDDVHPQYANFAEISHSHSEFAIAFAHIPAKLSNAKMQIAQETRQVVLEPSVMLVVPPTLIPGLINALTVQRASFEEKFGRIYEGESSDADK